MLVEKIKLAEKEVKPLSNRTFGLTFAVIFVIISSFPWLFGSGSFARIPLYISAAFVVVSLLLPIALTPLNKLWGKFGLLMHKVTNPLLMGIVFFVTVLPTGIILKLLGKDPMRRKLDSNMDSYWIQRTDEYQVSKDSFNNQF